jgi:hypothetical protein
LWPWRNGRHWHRRGDRPVAPTSSLIIIANNNDGMDMIGHHHPCIQFDFGADLGGFHPFVSAAIACSSAAISAESAVLCSCLSSICLSLFE